MATYASVAIKRLLSAQKKCELNDTSGDVVFAIFLEPHEPCPSTSPPTLFDRVVTYVVKRFQPSPVLVHVELVVPCAEASHLSMNFATYIGEQSGWQRDVEHNRSYYLETTANKWRAVPVTGKNAACLVRQSCNESSKVEYSLLRYATSAWGLRGMAWLLPDGPRAAAHCATLTARMLKQGIPGALAHCSAWYGPTTLYMELCTRAHYSTADTIEPNSTLGMVDTRADSQVDRLLRNCDEDVRRMSHADYTGAIRALTSRVYVAQKSGDDSTIVTAQKQLANALLRWSVLRTPQKL